MQVSTKKELILASHSPRRREYLAFLGFAYRSVVKEVEEITEETSPEKIVMALAKRKAEAVAKEETHAIVLGADTVVVFEDTILHKPASKQDAFRMLKQLQGNVHHVYTGVCLIDTDTQEVMQDFRKTKVKFMPMQESEIQSYIATEEPMDKAGAYGIQGIGGKYIEWICGDFYNVLGLPLNLVYTMLTKIYEKTS